jgi:tRNA uridine 5-carboxymethylaminomethyl modification enzyme
MLESLAVTPRQARRHGIDINQDGRRRSAFELLALPRVEFDKLVGLWPELAAIDPSTREQLAVDARYAAYVSRQDVDVETLQRDEAVRIDSGLDFSAIPGLSTELRHKLELHRPSSLAQAARIDGMTPAALMLLLINVKKAARRKTA